MSKVLEHSLLTDYDIYLFRQGNHYKIYEKLGSKIMVLHEQSGTHFAVWAPNARYVSVCGTFNSWDRGTHALKARPDGSGIWEGFIPGIGKGTLYKYHVVGPNGQQMEKTDPFSLFCEIPPKTASIVWDLDYTWKDSRWLKNRKAFMSDQSPYSVYEVHPGSWKKSAGGSQSLSYLQMAEEMVPYVKDMGFTHVEFMPVMEHPYYPSWGYQITGYFATTSRYGTPQDFMALVDAFHQAEIGVILDWVPSHFPTDGHGLAYFDGTHLYEHEDPKKGFHPDWKSYIFNYGRNEVRNFLISNALFWLEAYHIDGLRVDAVASMLYLDYSREEGQWIPNQYGGRENIEAIDFLREFNNAVAKEYPDVVTIAEESTAWGGVSKPVEEGGLGFTKKWMMGWMHDTTKYFQMDPFFRQHHHHQITFSLIYAFHEKFMLPLSHDEVVHGKASLLYKMPGDEWHKFANLRVLFGYMYTHPGSKLLFMGGEFGQTTEWSHATGLPWGLLQYAPHKSLQRWVKELNHFYSSQKALYELQYEEAGFTWVDHTDHQKSVLLYLRQGKNKYSDQLLVVCNFVPVERKQYKIGVPYGGDWLEVLNSDAAEFGGKGDTLNGQIHTFVGESHKYDQHLLVDLPALAMIVLKATHTGVTVKEEKP